MKPVANKRAMRGMTLIELVIAITVIGVAVSSVLAALSTQATGSAQAMIREQANGIGSAYLNEILQKNFLNGPGNTRATFDDINDYNAPAFNPVFDQSGNPVPGLSQFRVAVTVGQGNLNGINAANQVRRIDVTVNHASGVIVQVTGYRTAP